MKPKPQKKHQGSEAARHHSVKDYDRFFLKLCSIKLEFLNSSVPLCISEEADSCWRGLLHVQQTCPETYIHFQNFLWWIHNLSKCHSSLEHACAKYAHSHKRRMHTRLRVWLNLHRHPEDIIIPSFYHSVKPLNQDTLTGSGVPHSSRSLTVSGKPEDGCGLCASEGYCRFLVRPIGEPCFQPTATTQRQGHRMQRENQLVLSDKRMIRKMTLGALNVNQIQETQHVYFVFMADNVSRRGFGCVGV